MRAHWKYDRYRNMLLNHGLACADVACTVPSLDSLSNEDVFIMDLAQKIIVWAVATGTGMFL